VGGALGITNEHMGYSAQFLYPKEGGIGILPQSFLPHVNEVHYKKQLTAVDLKEKRVWFSGGDSLAYNTLVSTIPLPELLGMIRHLPSDIAEMKRGLRHISVLDVNLGIDRDGITDQHWIYFPEAVFPFYRSGSYSNFAAASAPSNATSLYLEISYVPEMALDKRAMIDAAKEGLERCGMLSGSDRVIADDAVDIPYAYVIYDTFRKKNLPSIIKYLKSNGVWSIGRYGSWKYMSMEDAILEGKAAAEVIRG
jgi:UDP-galactopyranose mutase